MFSKRSASALLHRLELQARGLAATIVTRRAETSFLRASVARLGAIERDRPLGRGCTGPNCVVAVVVRVLTNTLFRDGENSQNFILG
jgi:hypothetical protein